MGMPRAGTVITSGPVFSAAIFRNVLPGALNQYSCTKIMARVLLFRHICDGQLQSGRIDWSNIACKSIQPVVRGYFSRCRRWFPAHTMWLDSGVFLAIFKALISSIEFIQVKLTFLPIYNFMRKSLTQFHPIFVFIQIHRHAIRSHPLKFRPNPFSSLAVYWSLMTPFLSCHRFPPDPLLNNQNKTGSTIVIIPVSLMVKDKIRTRIRFWPPGWDLLNLTSYLSVGQSLIVVRRD